MTALGLVLQDGPAATTLYSVKRAPNWLRAVIDPDGKIDVLDQLDDKPSGAERIHVYERIGEEGFIFACRGTGAGRWATGTYRYVPMDGETVRETREWQAWCAIEANTARSAP